MSDFDGMSFDEWFDRERQDLGEQDNGAVPDDGRGFRFGDESGRPAERPVVQWPAPEQRRDEPPAKRGSGNRWMLVLLPLTAVLLVGVILLGVGFSYASKVAQITTIFPNVRVNGTNVGGMTVAQAAQVLGEDPAKYDNAAVTVTFPTGETLTVTAQQLGLKPIDGTAFAQAAYSYGRGGSLLANLKAYQACQKKPLDMAVQLAGQNGIDQSALAALVTPVAQAVEEKLAVAPAQIGEDAITLVKNTGELYVDIPEVCARITAAFEAENYEPIVYEGTRFSPEEQAGRAVDPAALLQQLYDQVYVEKADAMYDPVTGGVTDSVTGVRFDMEEARRQWDEAALGQQIVIPLIKEEPAVTGEQLSSRLFADVLAEKSTTLAGSSSARINNISLAAQAMNGVVLQPGQEFDYNACLGERTAAKGYQAAGVYSNGKHETALGGGICQGSSTLYYCALYANLDITVRYDHYFTVNYLPLGMDATVSWGGPDFKFRNSRDFPIRIEAGVANGYLTVRLLGTNVDGSYVDMTSNTWEDADFYYAQTYRNVYDVNGNLISSAQEAYSRYHKAEAASTQETIEQPQSQPQEQTVVQPDPGVQDTPQQAPMPDLQPDIQPDVQTETLPETQPEGLPEGV